MKIKNNTIFTIIITFLGICILLAGYLKFTETNIIHPKIEEENIENLIILENENKPSPAIINQKIPEANRNIAPQIAPKALSEETNKLNISLSVLDKNYKFEVEENSSVFKAMKELQNREEYDFDFKYKEYPSMGAFIYEINGMKGKSGAYWIYYVNDKEASVGASSYVLSPGDSILWKQE